MVRNYSNFSKWALIKYVSWLIFTVDYSIVLCKPEFKFHARIHYTPSLSIVNLERRLQSACILRGGAETNQFNPPNYSNNQRSRSDAVNERTESLRSSVSLADNAEYDPLGMYQTCLIIVLIWVTSGTLFYAFVNDWPLPQSFFYAIDAGMSIGFCTDVHETKIISKAFTVVYILLGASCVGGALALFIQDAMEGIVTANRIEYLRLLEQENKAGNIVQSDYELQSQHLPSLVNETAGPIIFFRKLANEILFMWGSNHRIYIVFIVWVLLGIIWGIVDQKWDVVTATHFAISALATGGLTAPPVNEQGILPARPAIFCGIYCLFGIPLFALTLGHFARVLVQHHVLSAEYSAIKRKLTPKEFDFAKRICTPGDNLMHLSDFIVLQLLRQGKITTEVVEMMRDIFERLDVDGDGKLTLERATSPIAADLDKPTNDWNTVPQLQPPITRN